MCCHYSVSPALRMDVYWCFLMDEGILQLAARLWDHFKATAGDFEGHRTLKGNRVSVKSCTVRARDVSRAATRARRPAT